jgi:lipopolysaccharide export system protein LptC
MTSHAYTADRLVIYRLLERRNRFVGLLRWLVPAAGLAVLALLVAQILVSSQLGRFSLESIRVAPDSITIEAPEYAGILDDGSLYRVWAESAATRTEEPDLIDLEDATLVIERPTGVTMDITASEGQLDTARELVVVDGVTNVVESTGTRGTLHRSVFDWTGQVLVSDGPVSIDYADGTQLEAAGMTFDTKTAIWTFSRVKVVLPDTPGAQEP